VEPVRARPPLDHLADGIGETGDVAQAGGHRRDPPFVEAQAVDDGRRRAPGFGPFDVDGIGGEQVGRAFLEEVGGGDERRVLGRRRRQRQRPSRGLCPPSEVCEAGIRGRHLHNLPVSLRILAGPIALVAVWGGGACDSTEPTMPERLTACEVVTASEVKGALGRVVSAPAESSEAATDQLAGRSGCAWSTADGERAVLVELVRTRDMARSVRRTGFSATARFRAATAEHGDGVDLDVGDRSLYVEAQSKLWVLEGDDLTTFEVAASPTSVAKAIAVDLGVKAVARLQRAD
jgi:hypothetical protein